ncbi:MarR family transcriptional regulator [Methanoculleus taiwanensis]|uniref:MarR family transcriptional regulator n=1 Tax=Methanoculleus taiwanensis TaxID=1550565 RepID=UPI001F4F572C
MTEISERLVLSPKAVIEHLQMMEREQLLISCQDERRRKYYYLSHNINVIIDLQKQDGVTLSLSDGDKTAKFVGSLLLFRRLIRARDDLLSSLEDLERDIGAKVNEIMRTGSDILTSEKELDIILALSHYNLTLEDLEELSGLSMDELSRILRSLIEKGLVERTDTEYMIRGAHGK